MTLPPDYWRIRAALVEAVELVADLMPYAGGYFIEKHGFATELTSLRAVLDETPAPCHQPDSSGGTSKTPTA